MRAVEVADLQRDRLGLVAAGPPLTPPRDWFEVPEPEDPSQGSWTVTADGQVYGYAALWDSCHTGKPGRCVKPPRSASQYGYYMTGLTEVDDGELIPTGRITLGTGHASLTASPAATAEHYDNTGAVAADVRITDGKHGIWVTGALRPDVTPERARELRGASLSGDWRNIRGKLEMLGLLAVNVPGFPVPRAMTASGEYEGHEEILALVAAGVIEGPLLIPEQLEEISDEDFEAGLQDLMDAMAHSEAMTAAIDPVDAAMASMSAAGTRYAEAGGGESMAPEHFTYELDGETFYIVDTGDGPEELTAAAYEALTAASPGRARSRKIAEVMREFKAGKLKSNGKKVTDRKQALAIALSESRHLTAAAQPEDLTAAAKRGKKVDEEPDSEADEVDAPPDEEEPDDSEPDDDEDDPKAKKKDMRASVDPMDLPVVAAGFFDESKHPRKGKGEKGGGQWTVKTTNAEGKSGSTQWDSKEQAEFDYKGVRDRAPFVEKGQLVDPSGETVAKFDRVAQRSEDRAARQESVSANIQKDRAAKSLDDPLAEVPEYQGQRMNATEYSDRVGSAVSRALEKQTGRIDLVHNDYVDDAVWNKWWAEGIKPTAAAKRFLKGEGATEAGKAWLAKRGVQAAGYFTETKVLQGEADPEETDENAPDDEGMEAAGKKKRKVLCADGDLPAARPPEPLPAGEVLAAAFTEPQRAKLAKKGQAMSDGSFPIRNRSDLRNAIASVGRASDPDAARRWIIKRARELKAVPELPASWDVDDSVTAAGFDESKHPRHEKGSKDGGQFAPKGAGKEQPFSQHHGAEAAKRAADIGNEIDDQRYAEWQDQHAVMVDGKKWYPDMAPDEWDSEMGRPAGTLALTDESGEFKYLKPAEYGKLTSGKLVEGPGGKKMSRTEKGELLDKQRAGTPSAKADRAAKVAREEGDTPAYLQTPNQATPEGRLAAARRSPNWDKSLDVEPSAKISELAAKFKTPRGGRTATEHVLAAYPELSRAEAKAVSEEIARRERLEGVRAGRVRYPETEFHI